MVTDANGLQRMAPDGAFTTLLPGFAGGQVNSTGTALLAWRASTVPGVSDQNYYITGVGRSGAKLILPAEPRGGRTRIRHEDVQLSPDGTAVAYIRQMARRDGMPISSALWTLSLTTGARTDLGPVPANTSIAWLGSSTIVAQSRDMRSLESINVVNGARSQLVRMNSPELVRAYERARPGAGEPTRITLLGASSTGGRPVLAVDLTAAASNRIAIDGVVVLLTGDTVKAYAVGGWRVYQSLTWGPDGYFAVLTTNSPSGCPPSNGAAYVGNVSTRHLARVPITGKNLIAAGVPTGAAFSPSGRYLALDYQGLLTFTATPTIGSLSAGTGYPVRLVKAMPGFGGTLQGWARP